MCRASPHLISPLIPLYPPSSFSLQPLALPPFCLSQASLPAWCLGLCALRSCSPTLNAETAPSLIPRPSSCTAAQISLGALTCTGVKPLHEQNLHSQHISAEPQPHSRHGWRHDLSWFLITTVNLQHLLSSVFTHQPQVFSPHLYGSAAHSSSFCVAPGLIYTIHLMINAHLQSASSAT